MGTETMRHRIMIVMIFMRVKLNNPQMGTETLTVQQLHSLYRQDPVKLNNPQMGTETNRLPSTDYNSIPFLLN